MYKSLLGKPIVLSVIGNYRPKIQFIDLFLIMKVLLNASLNLIAQHLI